VKVKDTSRKKVLGPALGAGLAALCSLMLWKAPLGQAWINASYDYSFLFGTRGVTNNVSFIMMDNEAYDHFHQTRGVVWDRSLHTQLLNKLADDDCALVVMDCFFSKPRDHAQDEALANAMRRHRHIVLMAEQSQVTDPTLVGMQPLLPAEPFLTAAGANWGVAWLDPDQDSIVRRHWPFPSPGPYPSLSESAARLQGVRLSESPHERWLRYYARDGAWTRMSYRFALTQRTNFFHNQIVFVGTQPQSSILDGEPDEFCTPYTRWTGEATGGAEIMLTCFLNLVNNDWLRRAGPWQEALILVFTGALIGGGLCRMRPPSAIACASLVAVTVMLAAVSCSYLSNYWFPWLVIAGGQVPCALACALVIQKASRKSELLVPVQPIHAAAEVMEALPDIPGYELLPSPFGQGAYGSVWLARNASHQWRAVKLI